MNITALTVYVFMYRLSFHVIMSPWWSLWLITLSQSSPVSKDTVTSPAGLEQDPPELKIPDYGRETNHEWLPSTGPLFKKYLFLKQTLLEKEEELWEKENKMFESFSIRHNTKPGNEFDGTHSPGKQQVDHQGEESVKSAEYFQLYQECRSAQLYPYRPLGLVSVCPKEYKNRTIRHMCESNAELFSAEDDNKLVSLPSLPVADTKSNVFANRFCAQCHNVPWTHSWQFEFECETQLLQEYETMQGGRPTLQMLETCGVKALPPFRLQQHECNYSNFNYTRRLNREKRSRQAVHTPHSEFPVSFSILMNFGFDGKAHILFSEAHHTLETPVDVTCPVSQIFDPEKHVCRPVVCDKEYVLKDQKCVKITRPKPTPTPIVDESVITDDVAQVSLEVNVSFSDYFLVFSKEFQSRMISELGSLFNISESRIMNFTIQSMEGRGTGNTLKIQKVRARKTRSGHTHAKSTQTSISGGDELPGSPTNSSVKMGLREYTTPFRDAILNFLHWLHQHKPESAQQDHTASPSVETKHESTTTSENTTQEEPPISVEISFLLLPPSTESEQESSVEKAVEEMTHMVHNNGFKMIVKNTRISVISVKEGEPLSLSSWCKQGVLNAYDDQHFSILTEENITSVYIIDTGEVYRPGQYDLMLFVEGRVVYSQNSLDSLSGYVFVCTMPRIKDTSCLTILLQKHEYSILKHNKAIVDIYTNTQRSIYEYRLAGNDSVEICMPNLADKSCARIELSSSEYDMLANKSIVYGGELYSILQYETSGNGSVEICIPRNYFADKADANVTDHVTGCDLAEYKAWLKAEGYLTATLSSISICSMAIVLLTYCLFDRLRNLPGMNTMNLTLVLFIAEMVFEFGSSSDNYSVCVAVGIVLHFFFLASFFWMNVMAYDVYMTFANSCILTRVRSKSKYLLKYVLYAWGSPAVIVSLCCFINFTSVFKRIHIGYGPVNQNEVFTNYTENSLNESATYSHYSNRQRLGCWIQKPMAVLAAFGGPILLILLANVIFYVKAIICIRAKTRSSINISNRSFNRRINGQNDVIIYVRMSTVMGFTWIIGFTSSFISSVASDGGAVVCLVLRILTILFTLFNCSQGFLIFFVFVCNRRVGRLYRQFVRRKWHGCKTFLNRQSNISSNKRKMTISKIS